jgi:prevent-host-death family protein
MSEALPLAYVKTHLSEIADRVEHQHDRVTLTRNGRPSVVMISPEELESLEETLDILSSADAVKEITQARKEVSLGDAVDGEYLRSKYLKR